MSEAIETAIVKFIEALTNLAVSAANKNVAHAALIRSQTPKEETK